MIRLAFIGIGIVSLWAWTAAPGQVVVSARQQTAFRARTDVVSVPVSVMRGREPVTGLTAADFELTDNGVRQTVDAASHEHVPIDVTLVLTGFPVDRDREFGRTLASAERTLESLNPADRRRIVFVADDVSGKLVGADYTFGGDPATREIEPGVGFLGGFRTPVGHSKHGWGVALADGLFYALAWPVAPDRRHLVVVFTDGHDTASTIDIDTLPKLAARSDAVLHAVLWDSAGGSGTSGGLWSTNPAAYARQREASFRAVHQAVQRTGGTLQRIGNAPEALAEILADFRSSYVLRYRPRDTPAPGWHELRVRVTRGGSFTVRARRGYEGG